MAESRWFLSLGSGIAQYSSCEINHGLRDITFRNQLPELGAVYRFGMLYSLSRRGDAPAVMGKINRSKTPYVAVLLSTGAAFLTVVVNYYAPAKVFKFLIDSSGAIALLVYLVIAVSQLRMRKILRAEGSEIRLRMWLYPWLTAGNRFYYLCVGSDAIPPGATVRSALHRLISDWDYLYRANYGSLEKADNVAKTPIHNTR